MRCVYSLGGIFGLRWCGSGDIVYNGVSAEIALATDLHPSSVEMRSTSSLSDRYTYDKSITATFDGRAVPNLDGKRLIIVDNGNEAWLLDIEFYGEIKWVYELNGEDEKTTWTITLNGNTPIIPCTIAALSGDSVCGYSTGYDLALTLVPKASSIIDLVDGVVMSDGRVEIDGKCSFTEEYGDGVHDVRITCSLSLDTDNTAVSDNLQKFMLYRHVGVIRYGGGVYIVGLEHGMDCQVDIQTSSDEGNITLTLRDVSGEPSVKLDDVRLMGGEDIFYAYVKYAHDGTVGFVCGGDGMAYYLLQRGFYQDGTATYTYKVLQGHENDFPTLHVNGTFYTVKPFDDDTCVNTPTMTTTLPPSYCFISPNDSINGVIDSDLPWEAVIVPPFVMLSVSRGDAGSTPITITANAPSTESGDVVFEAANGRRITISVSFIPSDITITPTSNNATAFTATIKARGVMPTLISSPAEAATTRIDSYTWEASVPVNNTTTERLLTWVFDNKTVTLTQSGCLEKWAEEGNTVCDGVDLYAEERRFVSYDGVNWTPTSESRLGELVMADSYFCPE